LDYGSTLHFATVGSDNGHDGDSGVAFLDHPEVINDFAFRAIHVEAVLGKQIVEAYYKRTHDKSYYLGCSTGGRQGIQSALLFPEDFDGVIAGAPGTDFNHLIGWTGMVGRNIGAPDANTSASFIPASLWPIISQEILKQCDGLDGVEDGIITEPDECIFRPEALLCNATTMDESSCITAAQVDALTRVYEPLFGTKGELIFPRYDPGAEGGSNFEALLSGAFFPFTKVSHRHDLLN
jgi:feruloyl esterase